MSVQTICSDAVVWDSLVEFAESREPWGSPTRKKKEEEEEEGKQLQTLFCRLRFWGCWGRLHRHAATGSLKKEGRAQSV